MCGLVGFISPQGHRQDRLQEMALQMAKAIAHRGPDDAGVWVDAEKGLALAHRRLAIVDVSAAGHQPMCSACDRYVIVFNGEIYNHLALRTQLNNSGVSVRWRGHSDTETLLACIAAWGLDAALKAAVGMFAFALWDRQEKVLSLARDRMGEKPLYYGFVNGVFAFASELKAIRALPGTRLNIDRAALGLFMRYSYVPEPHCIYTGLKKLSPGARLELPQQALASGVLPEPTVYWSATEAAQAGIHDPLVFSDDVHAAAALEQKLSESVRLQMVADVPLGAFLSGGIDSSTVVALMQAQSSRPVQTFSIGFQEGAYNEAEHAKAVAQHLGTDHTELYVTPADALAVIPQLPVVYDEPFADVSQLPTVLLSQLVRRKVTVSLSGDGGDELFGGYTRYFMAARLWQKLARLPMPARQVAARAIKALSPAQWDAIYGVLGGLLPAKYSQRVPGERLHKAAGVLASRSGADLYTGLVSHWNPAQVVQGLNDALPPNFWPSLPTLSEQMMAVDAITYLPGQILTKVDRAAMSASLETRVPLLDHRIFEFAWRLPLHYKIRNGEGKWLLKQVLYNHVPRELIERPKMGFGVPIDSWLRGPLKDWAAALLDPARLAREGHFKPDAISKKWNEHLSGQKNWQYLLWDVLMFQSWLESTD